MTINYPPEPGAQDFVVSREVPALTASKSLHIWTAPFKCVILDGGEFTVDTTIALDAVNTATVSLVDGSGTAISGGISNAAAALTALTPRTLSITGTRLLNTGDKVVFKYVKAGTGDLTAGRISFPVRKVG